MEIQLDTVEQDSNNPPDGALIVRAAIGDSRSTPELTNSLS